MVWNLVEADSHESKVVHINFKAIAVLLVLTAAVCGGVHYLHLQQVARHIPLVLEEAKKRYAAEEYASALAFYETYLGYRQKKKDVDALADYALLKAKLAKDRAARTAAFYALLSALNDAPQRDDLARESVQLGVWLNRVPECAKELDRLLRHSPDDPEVLLLGARGALRLREFDKSRTRYELVLNTPLANKAVYLELLHLLTEELKDHASADELMIRLLQRFPDEPDVHAVAASYYVQRGNLDLADTELALAMSDEKAATPALVRLQSQIARARQRPLELEASLTRLVELSASDHRAELELAELEISLGRRQAAIQRLKRLGQDPGVTIEHLWQVIIALDAAGAASDATELRERLKQRDRDGAYADSLAMRDKMVREDWKGALEVSRPLVNRTNVSTRFLATMWQWRADCCEKTDDWEGMMAALRRAVSMGEDVDARSRLAQLLFRMGRFTEAQSEYALLVQKSPIYASEFVSLLQQASQGQTKPSLSRQEVDNLFQRWRAAVPGEPLPVLSQLDFSLRVKDRAVAEELIQQGLRQWPQEVGFHLARISLQRETGDWTAAFASLDEADAACGRQAALLAQRILCLELSAPEDLRQQLEACLEDYHQLNRDSQASVWPVLLRGLQRAQCDPQKIAELQKSYSGKNPTDVRMLLFHVQAATAASDLETARRHLETLRTTAGEQSPAYQVAAVLCELKSAAQGEAQALEKAQHLLTALLASPGEFRTLVATLQADLFLLQKRPREALEQMRAAVEGGDPRLSTLKRTLSLMVVGGRLDQAFELLKSLGSQDAGTSPATVAREESLHDDLLPADRSLESLRAALAAAAEESWTIALVVYRIDVELKEFDRAMERLQRAVELEPRAPIAWANWLSQLERRQPDRLDSEVAKAREHLSVVDQGRLLPAFLLRQKRPNDARSLLDAARKVAPADPVLFSSLVSLIRQGADQKAATSRLEELLSETLADERDVMQDCRRVARRELARLWSASRGYRVYLEAIRLAEEAVRDSSGAEEDVQLQGEIHSLHVGHWQPALEAYRKLETASTSQRQAEAFSAQAKIHERRRRWDDEQAALEACRKLAPEDTSIALRLLLNAVRRKDAPAAQSLTQDIQGGTQDRHVLLHADVLMATFAEDRTQIVDRIRAAYVTGRASRDAVREWLTLLHEYQPLQEILKAELDAERVETMSRYVEVLAQNQQVTEAVSQLSVFWKSGQHEVAMAIAASLASSPHVSPSDLEALRASAAKIAASDDASLRVLAASAALEDFSGNYPAALELYRRILAKAPDNVIALNNQAFLAAVSKSSAAAEHLPAIERALQKVGPVDQLIDTQGMLHLLQGDAKSAAACFEEAWNQRGDTAHELHLAWAYSVLGKTAEAQQRFRSADAADPPAKLHPLERPLDAVYRKKAGMASAAEQSAEVTP